MSESSPSVLILAADPMAAALVGAAIELAGGRPLYPGAGERPRDALLRHRPALVLVDCDDETSCADAFLGPVLMTGARVAVFGSARSRRDVSELVARLGVRALRLPADVATVEALLETLLEARRLTRRLEGSPPRG